MPLVSQIYATPAEADTYFSTRLNVEVWDEADVAKKTKALSMATRAIDNLNFIGEKTNITQELQFPRGGDTLVPDDIKVACCEVALGLLDGFSPNLEVENLAYTSQGVGEARVTYDRAFVLEHLRAGIPSVEAWNILKRYLADGNKINFSREN